MIDAKEKAATAKLANPEQAAELAALEGLVKAAPAVPVPGEEQKPEAVPRPPLEQEIAGMLLMVTGILGPILPTVAKIYSKETCEAIGQAVAPVCKKHGWLQEGIGGKWGEEIMALVVVGPIGWATIEAAKADIAARTKAPEKPAQGQLPLQEKTPVPVKGGTGEFIVGAPIAHENE